VTLAETNYRQTGEYVCKGAKEFEVSTASVYLFVPGTCGILDAVL
jgi:hypothetical protein